MISSSHPQEVIIRHCHSDAWHPLLALHFLLCCSCHVGREGREKKESQRSLALSVSFSLSIAISLTSCELISIDGFDVTTIPIQGSEMQMKSSRQSKSSSHAAICPCLSRPIKSPMLSRDLRSFDCLCITTLLIKESELLF